MAKKIIIIVVLVALGASLFFMPSIFGGLKMASSKPMAAPEYTSAAPSLEPAPLPPGNLSPVGGSLTVEEPKVGAEPAKSSALDIVQTTKTIVDLIVEMLQKLLGLVLATIGVVKTAQEISKKGKKKLVKA